MQYGVTFSRAYLFTLPLIRNALFTHARLITPRCEQVVFVFIIVKALPIFPTLVYFYADDSPYASTPRYQMARRYCDVITA